MMDNTLTRPVSLQPSHPVWVVDDDEDDQALLRNAFQSLTPPLTPVPLDSGEALLACLAQRCPLPGVILLDLNMPGLSGFDVLTELATQPTFRQIPIFILSTSSAETDKGKALKLGASDYLTKPASYQSLVDLAYRVAHYQSD